MHHHFFQQMIPHLCHLLAVHACQICISNAQNLITTTQTLILGIRVINVIQNLKQVPLPLYSSFGYCSMLFVLRRYSLVKEIALKFGKHFMESY